MKAKVDGIEFDSKLESNCYILLRDSGIKFELQPEFLLQEPFLYIDITGKQRSYSKMVYTGDFKIGNIIVEVKGFARAEYMLRRKLFHYKYVRTGEYKFVEVFHPSEMKVLIEKFLQ